MQGKLFLLYCSVLSLGGNVNPKRMLQPDMGSIFHINNQWNILVIGNYYVNYQNYQNLMLLTSLDTKRTLMHHCDLMVSRSLEQGFLTEDPLRGSNSNAKFITHNIYCIWGLLLVIYESKCNIKHFIAYYTFILVSTNGTSWVVEGL